MKKLIRYTFLVFLMLGFSSFVVHKFYVSIYQVNFNRHKQRLEITSRIFIDDLNAILMQKYNHKTHVCAVDEVPQDIILMKKYIAENFYIKINGQPKRVNYLSKELEGNVVICYFNITEIPRVKTLEIQNTALFELNLEQQNIIQATINGSKQSLLLTSSNSKGILNW